MPPLVEVVEPQEGLGEALAVSEIGNSPELLPEPQEGLSIALAESEVGAPTER